jgi:hypothetical protein
MKIPHLVSVAAVFCGLILISVPRSSHAGTNLLSTNVVGGTTGWFTANVWKTNDGFGNPIGNFAASGHPSAGNTYKLIQGPNPAIGNNLAGTRTRNLYTNGTPVSLWTFLGDSLELTTNTEIRFKQIGTPATIETVNFPGVGGNPGLILNGGMLNVGDAIVQSVAGIIQAAPGSQSYFCPGNNDGASMDSARAFNIVGQLTGSGTLVIFEGGTANAQRISGNSNTFSGQWIVKAGWLLGAVTNSLGTNSITMDPAYVLPVPPFSSTAPVVDIAGPAVLEVNYNHNSAGVLTLNNGGMMRLHQNCAFSAVLIDGTPLSAGTHYYVELNANYPNNFPAGGEGAITVQASGSLPLLLPSFVTQPGRQLLFAGATGHFTVGAIANTYPPLTFKWRKGGVELTDGGNISGATNATLTITGVSATDVANYDVLVFNANGSVTSASAALTLVPLSGEVYEAAVAAAKPVAFYQLNETGDPATNNSPAYDYLGGYNGTYGAAVQNGNPTYNIAGPVAVAGYPGFASGNKAAQFANLNAAARVTVTPWNMNTNTVTITAWVNPSGPQNPFNAIVFCRGGGTVVGLNYAGYLDANGNSTLGYHWNDQLETRNWNSGLAAPPGQWSFVALVVTPSNATIHVMNTNGLASASQNFTHIVQSFSGTTLIGDDSAGAAGARVFNGTIDDVAIFNRSLSKTELVTLYTNASSVTAYAPIILAQPASQTLYPGQTAQFKVAGGGSDPLTYQWRAGATGSGVYTNLADGGRISGAASASLTIANINASDALDYLVVLANAAGSVTSSVATLTVPPVGPPENITLSFQQAAVQDWESTVANNTWSDGQPASVSAAGKPGSTYEVLTGARLRSPEGATVTNFPGNILTLDGNAVWNVNPAAGALISEFRFKQPTYGPINGRVNFKRLVMNGGQLDAGNDGLLLLGGRIDVLTNAPISNDGGNDRGYMIDAWLTGTGTIEYHGYTGANFQSGYRNPLNIAGTSNTFSGRWNIVQGVLLGSAPNCLGTNDIIIGTLGAFETTYDIANTNGNLFLSGKMFLHQNDTFRSVTVSGTALNQGTYTYAQLAAAYPANFPATWTMQNSSTVSNASGSITVLAQASPAIVTQPQPLSLYPSETAQFTVSAVGFQPLSYRWRKNGANMSDGTTAWGSIVSGAATTNLTIANVTNNDGANYTVVITNSIGSSTSSVATLTIKPTFPPENITMSVIQPAATPTRDWNTGSDWSDGLAASESALQKPGSTYEVLPGARLRSPAGAAFATFPGNVLTVSGDSVWLENSPTTAEIRFKHANPGTVYFKKLILNGGMLDSGDNGVTVIQGELHINDNTTNSFYADTAAGQDRPFQIDAWLTGGGMIEYHAFDTTFSGNLNVTGTSNTFNGTWHVVQGVVLGSGPNSLGTNDIIVETSGALETSYNINNPKGSLILNGQMFLHQNDTFRAVNVVGTDLAPGTYTFATLNSTYPAIFPAIWPPQIGSGVTTGSGSITVLGNVLPHPTMQVQFSGDQVTLTWAGSFWLVEANEVTGPWVTNAAATSPFPVTPSLPRKFYGLQPK